MSDIEHGDLIASADAWAKKRLLELGEAEPEALQAAIEHLNNGAGLAVCTVVAGGQYQIDLCLIGTDRRMKSLVSVTTGQAGAKGAN